MHGVSAFVGNAHEFTTQQHCCCPWQHVSTLTHLHAQQPQQSAFVSGLQQHSNSQQRHPLFPEQPRHAGQSQYKDVLQHMHASTTRSFDSSTASASPPAGSSIVPVACSRARGSARARYDLHAVAKRSETDPLAATGPRCVARGRVAS